MNLLKKLKLLYLASKLYKKIKEGVKMKKLLEREFLLTVLTIVASIWGASKGLIPQDMMIKIMAIVTMVYTVARAIVKFTPTKKDDEILKKLEEIFKNKK